MSDNADIADMEIGHLEFRKTKKSGERYSFRADSDVEELLARALKDFPDASKTINAALRSGLKQYKRK